MHFLNGISNWGKDAIFTIHAVKGDVTVVPDNRSYVIKFRSVEKFENIVVKLDGLDCPFETVYDDSLLSQSIIVKQVETQQTLEIYIKDIKSAENLVEKDAMELIAEAQIEYVLKEELIALISQEKNEKVLISELASMIDGDLFGALIEIITAR
ncbi:MAG TPA: hypothetical protein DCG38_11135 [Eubacteriaceae bacterium]|nr:hypothetical protein [Eubacteriaceae bacterium]